MHVYLIRHAQSENNVLTEASIHRRKVDPSLTKLGFRQRDLLAQFLASGKDVNNESFDISHLYCSAMYRALLTAQPLTAALERQAQVWVDLHEKGGMFQRRAGRVNGFTGMTRAQIEGKFLGYELPRDISEDGWYDAGLGMEPETYSLFRAIKVANALRRRGHSDDVIALISHAGFLDVLLKAIFDQLPSRPHIMRFFHDNTAITRVNYQGSRPTLHYMNRVDHLPPELRSF